MRILFGYFGSICNKYHNKKHIYKWLLAVPYVEAVLAMSSVYYVLNRGLENDLLVIIVVLIVIMPLVHIIQYYYIPNRNTKMPINKRIKIILFIIGYCMAVMGVLYYCYITYKAQMMIG